MTAQPPSSRLGNTASREQHIAPALVERIAATLGENCPAAGQALSTLWHWAFFQSAEGADALGPDGHPARGGFLPPAADRQRT